MYVLARYNNYINLRKYGKAENYGRNYWRKEEITILKTAFASKEAELIAIYGRRRIGKTYLIRSYYEDWIAFELTDMNNAALKTQLLQFSKALQKAADASLAGLEYILAINNLCGYPKTFLNWILPQ
jgi:predicted AAA+ superfamily ATPase